MVVSTVSFSLHSARTLIFSSVMVVWLMYIFSSAISCECFFVENIPMGTERAVPSAYFTMYLISSLLGTAYCRVYLMDTCLRTPKFVTRGEIKAVFVIEKELKRDRLLVEPIPLAYLVNVSIAILMPRLNAYAVPYTQGALSSPLSSFCCPLAV